MPVRASQAINSNSSSQSFIGDGNSRRRPDSLCRSSFSRSPPALLRFLLLSACTIVRITTYATAAAARLPALSRANGPGSFILAGCCCQRKLAV